ncbi:expressed protein [Phakopsora pachyrhizi]|uniref:Expressed protein n=1 Tax=Phakopsora pachyrhizi TaxID=170000 RepID=A0AAV0BW80_PHAPC|nr:expressed protein [Phakopsora pachyrhizi]
MILASRPRRITFCIWLLQVALGCLIVEAGFIAEIFREKSETSGLKSQINEPLLTKIGSNAFVQPTRGKLKQLSSSKVPKFERKKTLEDIFEGVTRKYYDKIPTSSKNPIEPSTLMAEIAEIVKEVKNKKFIRIARMDREEDCEILDKKLSQSLEEASVKYREIMNLSNENRGLGKNKASAFDQIEETLGNRRDEDIAEEVRDKEILNELLKVKDTIQSATKYLLEQELVRREDISKTLEAMSNHFYDEAWFQKNIFDRSRREEDFDPFFSSIGIKEYIYNHPSIEQHRILLKGKPLISVLVFL